MSKGIAQKMNTLTKMQQNVADEIKKKITRDHNID